MAIVRYPDPVRSFTSEEQAVVEQLNELDYVVLVSKLPVQVSDGFVCQLSHPDEGSESQTGPTYGPTVVEALRSALREVART
jgi:hypothetical protein